MDWNGLAKRLSIRLHATGTGRNCDSVDGLHYHLGKFGEVARWLHPLWAYLERLVWQFGLPLVCRR